MAARTTSLTIVAPSLRTSVPGLEPRRGGRPYTLRDGHPMAVKSHSPSVSAPPRLGQRSRIRTWLTAAIVGAVALPILSTLFGLYERVLHWGKLVHGLEGFLVALTV